MNAKQVLFTSILALAAAGAMADDITIDNSTTGSGVSRQQVRADVLKARKAGTLLAAGERYEGAPIAATSTVARSDVKAQVTAARAAGQLLAAGEALPNDPADAAPSTVTRAEVKAEVLAARKAGTLLPAGEGTPEAVVAQRQPAANPFRAVAKAFHHDTTQ